MTLRRTTRAIHRANRAQLCAPTALETHSSLLRERERPSEALSSRKRRGEVESPADAARADRRPSHSQILFSPRVNSERRRGHGWA